MKPGATAAEQESVIGGLRARAAETAGLETSFSAPELLSFDKPLEIEIQGYDLASLRAASDEVARSLCRAISSCELTNR